MRFSWTSDFCLNLLMGRGLKRFHIFVSSLFFMVCAVAFLNGCIIPTCSVVCRNAMVQQGRKAYLNKDYSLSRQIFSQLALKEGNQQLYAAGFYGNICLDMILAQNAPAFRKARLKLLLLPSQAPCKASINAGRCADTWSRMYPGILEKALAHGVILLESERLQIIKKLNTLYASQNVYKKERLSMLKNLNSISPEIRVLRKQNMDQNERITDLLHQITVLEKIDKERQEQRKNQ